MKNSDIVSSICLLFLITSPIGQWIFGLGGGFLIYIFSENDAQIIGHKLMALLSLISIFGFIISKSQIMKLAATILATFFICNFVLFFSMESKMVPHFFYPQSFILGSLISFIILKIIERFKTNNKDENEENKPKLGWF